MYNLDRENYRKLAKTQASFIAQGVMLGTTVYKPLWWKEKVIRIFWESGIKTSAAKVVAQAIQQRIAEYGMSDFRIELFGDHKSVIKQINQSTKNGQFFGGNLMNLCLSEHWRRHQQHADVIITKRAFYGDSVSWGISRFSHGAMVFALYGNRQDSLSFLKKVALHEASHLLGFAHHCDDFKVDGYNYDSNCNMHYSCPSEIICKKCKEYLPVFRAEFNRLTGQAY